MIVPKKPLLMRRMKYLRILADTFRNQIPPYLCTGPISLLTAVLMFDLSFQLCIAYPDRNELQKVIDVYSARVLIIDEEYKKNNPEVVNLCSAE